MLNLIVYQIQKIYKGSLNISFKINESYFWEIFEFIWKSILEVFIFYVYIFMKDFNLHVY
jgi:hypothetical protein